MTKYEQGRRQQQMVAVERQKMMVGVILCVVALIGIVIMTIFGFAGCASSRIALADPLAEVGSHETLRGLVQIAQMGEDCTEQSKALKRILRDTFVAQGIPAPSIVEVRTLSGSSFCGFSQGTASEVGMLDLGARNTARAEVSLYWSDIKYSELQKAHSILMAMRPIPAAAPKVARVPAK